MTTVESPRERWAREGRVALGYGEGREEVALDPRLFELLAPADAHDEPLDDGALEAALDAPIGSPRLEEIVRAGERVVVVVPDATRASGSRRVVGALLERLRAAGEVSILVGGGTHRAPTAAEVDAIVGADVAMRVPVHAHDAHDPASHAIVGTTSRGTPVEVNRRLVEADRVVLVGAITFHYFAGFSGGRKAFLPGCASNRAIQRNHLLAFDPEALSRREGVASARLDGNPVSEDMEEAARLFGPSFLVNTVMNAHGEIVAMYAGDWLAAHRSGCAEYLAAHAVPVDERRPVVVVSAGGAPRDVNLIQSHKAMEHASAALEEGGTMVVVAECAQGLGRDDLLDWFPPGGSHATALKLRDNYFVYGQTAWAVRWKSERFRVRLVSSLADETVQRLGLEPHRTLESALEGLGDSRGYVIPFGLTTLPILRGSHE